MEKYKLCKPITFLDETVTELEFDFDGLLFTDLEVAERDARKMLAKGEIMITPETSKLDQAHVAAKACGRPVRLIRSLGARDGVQVCLMVQNFLLGGESEEDEESQAEKQENGNPSTPPPKTPKNPTAPSTT